MVWLALLTLTALDAGRARVRITPEPGTPMAGYYSLRLATGTHDDLFAQAIVMREGPASVALVSCDLVMLPPLVVEEARRLASAATGIPAGHIMISATHSHTGPVLRSKSAREQVNGGALPVLDAYMESLPKRIAESVRLAHADLQPAVLKAGSGREPSLAFNRRFHMKDGTVGWNPGKRNPNIVRPAGPVDDEVGVLWLDSGAGKPLAAWVNYALHLDTVGGLEWSADYPYTLRSILARVKGDDSFLTLFTEGAAGNINHIDVSHDRPQKGHAEAARIGTVLAGEVVKTMTRMTPVAGGIKVSSETLRLALPEVTPGDVDRAKTIDAKLKREEKVPFIDTVFAYKALDVAARKGQAQEAEVQVMTVGRDLAIVALPGEVFVELGQAIKKGSPFARTFVVTLAHGAVTYYPDRAAVAQGNYEVVTSRVAEGSGEKLVDAALRLLKEAY